MLNVSTFTLAAVICSFSSGLGWILTCQIAHKCTAVVDRWAPSQEQSDVVVLFRWFLLTDSLPNNLEVLKWRYSHLSSTTDSRSGLQLKSFFPPNWVKWPGSIQVSAMKKAGWILWSMRKVASKLPVLSPIAQNIGVSFTRRIEIIVSCTSLRRQHLQHKWCTIVVSWQQVHINIQTTKRLFFCLWHNPKHMEILVCLAQLQIHNWFSLFQIHHLSHLDKQVYWLSRQQYHDHEKIPYS